MKVANQSLPKGAMLRGGAYRIERVLGQGGFGITYLATDMTLERRVCIKEFFPSVFCNRSESTTHVTVGSQGNKELVERFKAKFLKEARNIAKFDHPGVIRIHAAFEENNTAYYVMDFIQGQSLADMVQGKGPMPAQKAINYIAKVGNALEYVHSHWINHLDVKPDNIMVRSSDDQPILIDFGLSKQYDTEGQQTSTTPIGISHGYAPMEQYNQGGVSVFSPQTDIYSLAATLYYLLTAKVPPQATKLIEESLTFPSTVPTPLQSAIVRAMSPVRNRRHATVSEFLKEIDSPKVQNKEFKINDDETAKLRSKDTKILTKNTQDTSIKEKPKKSDITRKLFFIFVCFITVLALCGIFYNLFQWFGHSQSTQAEEVLTEEPVLETVKINHILKTWESPLGKAAYEGDVDENGLPHGQGVARIFSGEYGLSTYEGTFVHGNMEGQTIYTLKNGDKFVGTFKNNQYYEGTYTVKKTGEYFKGTFKNGQPDQGSWYDSNGNIID